MWGGRWRGASAFEHRAVVVGGGSRGVDGGVGRVGRWLSGCWCGGGPGGVGGQDGVGVSRAGRPVGGDGPGVVWARSRCSPRRSTRCAEALDPSSAVAVAAKCVWGEDAGAVERARSSRSRRCSRWRWRCAGCWSALGCCAGFGDRAFGGGDRRRRMWRGCCRWRMRRCWWRPGAG